ncbi:MAG: hypothetical protein R3E96_02405 [Planctomycetota bacterium]
MAQDPRNPRLHTLVQFDHPAELLERVGEVFASDEALYSLPLGIEQPAAGHSYGPGTPRFFTVESGGCLGW